MNRFQIQNLCAAAFTFIAAFLLIPWNQLQHLSMMPGDLGDARLNHYFLENIYLFFKGQSPSLIHLNFFYPFPYTLGFSDNLFGSAPVYLIARLLTQDMYLAFQLWYLISYVVNYIACIYALKKLQLSSTASIFGAIIFTFSFPVTTQIIHAQLAYNFGTPLFLSFFTCFLIHKNWRDLTIGCFWLVWQFYCSIYLGFFAAAMGCSMLFVLYFFTWLEHGSASMWKRTLSFMHTWHTQSTTQKKKNMFIALCLLGLMLFLFYPYIKTTQLYHAKRPFHEVSSMLPRIQSYFLADHSHLWASHAHFFDSVPMRHEHQMFIGSIAMVMALFGYLTANRHIYGFSFSLIAQSFGFMVLITLAFGKGDYTLWHIFHWLPLASAIRAMSRIILMFLFPISFFCGVGIDKIREYKSFFNKVILICLFPAIIFEFSQISISVSPKSEWNSRLKNIQQRIPKNVSPDAILFFAQTPGPWFADELDAMWASLQNSTPTLNGYSGLMPPFFTSEFQNNCSEIFIRLVSYLNFIHDNDPDAYRNLANRIVPIGFTDCDSTWKEKPNVSISNNLYPPETFQNLHIEYLNKEKKDHTWFITINIHNQNNYSISSLSNTRSPIRLSWRFTHTENAPNTNWTTRVNLPQDIAAHGILQLTLPVNIQELPEDQFFEVSIVQEHVFWAHDVGFSPLKINWDISHLENTLKSK